MTFFAAWVLIGAVFQTTIVAVAAWRFPTISPWATMSVLSRDQAWRLVLKFLIGCAAWPIGLVALFLPGGGSSSEEQRKEIRRRSNYD